MAGNASNWYKPTRGALKGQAVYISTAKMSSEDLDRITRVGALRGTNQRDTILEQLNRMYQEPQERPAGAAKTNLEAELSQAAANRADQLTRQAPTIGTPTPSAKPIDMAEAERLIFKAENTTVQYQSGTYTAYRMSDSTSGHYGLSAIYDRQGFHAKPDVVTSAQLDAYIKKGEIELHRGTMAGQNGDPDAYSEAFRSGATHYAGNGIYGNGTYAGSRVEAGAYVGGAMIGKGRIIRMTIKADAKVGEYNEINNQRLADAARVQASPRYQRYENAVNKLQAQRNAILKPKLRHPAKIAAQKEAAQALGERMAKIRARQAREAGIRVYQDTGAYAAAKGYDAYRVAGTKSYPDEPDYHVILNRGAVRVQDTSIVP